MYVPQVDESCLTCVIFHIQMQAARQQIASSGVRSELGSGDFVSGVRNAPHMLRLMLLAHALTRDRVVRRAAASGQMPRGESVDRPVSRMMMVIITARSVTITAFFPLTVQSSETCQ